MASYESDHSKLVGLYTEVAPLFFSICCNFSSSQLLKIDYVYYDFKNREDRLTIAYLCIFAHVELA